jgi:hypothetical protein
MFVQDRYRASARYDARRRRRRTTRARRASFTRRRTSELDAARTAPKTSNPAITVIS